MEIAPGDDETSANIPVRVVADALDEDNETATVELGTPVRGECDRRGWRRDAHDHR